MKHYIKIAELIGTDIRSRNNAKRILEVINTDDEYTLDFTSVEFMSRSFTDELCNIIDYNNNVTIDEVTMERQIEDIYTIVNRGSTYILCIILDSTFTPHYKNKSNLLLSFTKKSRETKQILCSERAMRLSHGSFFDE